MQSLMNDSFLISSINIELKKYKFLSKSVEESSLSQINLYYYNIYYSLSLFAYSERFCANSVIASIRISIIDFAS